MNSLKLFPTLLLLPLQAYAVDLFQGMKESMVYPPDWKKGRKVEVTHYSATPRGGSPCGLEGGAGGPDSSPSGFRPLSYRIDKPGLMYGRPTVLTAVPQEGGTRGAFGCFFALPDAYPGKLFYAGDFYGEDSNGKQKTDVSSPCTSIVNTTLRSKMVVYNCPGKKGGVAPPILRAEGGEEPPPKEKPNPEPVEKPPQTGGTCGWYGIFSCTRALAPVNQELARTPGEGLTVINTDSLPNFARGWYCMVYGPADQAGASAKVQKLRKRYSSAYVKKGC